MVDRFADAHAHASVVGLGYGEVVRRFRAAGGGLIALVQLSPGSYGLSDSLEGVARSLEAHANLCDRVRREYGGVLCLGGLHPATVDKLLRSSRDPATVYRELEKGYMRRLESLLREGLLDGLGEFGRPHFPTVPESWAANELLLVRALEVAKDVGGVVHVHSENAGLLTLGGLKLFTDRAGIPRWRVLAHHVPPSQARLYAEEGFYVSVVGRSRVVGELGSECSNVLVESDYLDDPRRPGVVMYPWEIGREVLRAVEEGRLASRCSEKVLLENPSTFYGVVT